MIFVKNTPNNAEVAIYGDFKDFEGLYDSLHNIVGFEEDFVSHGSSRLRVLGICYDIRHAMMGDREIEFVENSMDSEKMKRMAVIAPEKNVYLKIYVLWPEVLFVTMVLNDFVKLYGRRKAKSKYDFMLDKQTIWDENIAQVRLFQAAIAKCIKETVSEASYSRMMSLMNKDYTWFEGYATQYLDVLNCRYIDMDNEKRLKSIPTMTKRLAEHNEEYRKQKLEVSEAARYYNTTEDNIKAPLEYPDDYEW